jgi:hypothetical protein
MGRYTLQITSNSEANEATKLIVRLFQAVASTLRGWLPPSSSRRDFEEEQAAEAALQKLYPKAVLQWNQMEQRARKHGIKFSPLAQAQHRAAILDFLDNPDALTHLTPMHATWFFAIDPNGQPAGSMSHPANLAQFQIVYRYAVRHRWDSEFYTTERALWTPQQWRDYERQERDLRAANLGRVQIRTRHHRL